MRISVRVKPNSGKNQVVPQADGSLVVFVNAPPVEGKANQRMVELLAEHFGKRRREIIIVSGEGSRNKIIEVT